MARTKRKVEVPRRLSKAGIEGMERHPAILGSDWSGAHSYHLPEQILIEVTDGMTEWIKRGQSGCPELVSRALQHGKWRISLSCCLIIHASPAKLIVIVFSSIYSHNDETQH